MQVGCLGVGHMASFNERAGFKYPPEREAVAPACSEPSDAKGKAPADRDGADSATASSPSHLDRKPKSILERQLSRKLLSMLSEMMNDTKTVHSGLSCDRRNIAALADMLWYRVGSHENKERLEPELVSAFDVDRPCLLAVPYSGEWEMLPRPSIRSMSICWVVERVSHEEKYDRHKDNSGEHLDRDSRMGWPVGKDDAEAEGHVPDEESWISSMEADTSAEQPNLPASESSLAVNARSQEKGCGEIPEPSYRVLNKVQGLWQILPDIALEKYTFI